MGRSPRQESAAIDLEEAYVKLISDGGTDPVDMVCKMAQRVWAEISKPPIKSPAVSRWDKGNPHSSVLSS